MLRTRMTELFGIRYPVMSAPMSGHSGGTLAAAVSKAGGLGSFGAIDPKGPSWVREQIELVRAGTDGPFAVGFITAFIPFMEGNFGAVMEARVPVVVLSFGAPEPWITRARESGARTVCQVQTLDGARAAQAAGAVAIVVQGNEAGGHTGELPLLPMLSRVRREMPEMPIIAAGGIADARSFAAVLAAGADGACAGTAFLATPEATEVPDVYKDVIVRSDGSDTTYSRVYDVLDGMPWPEGIAGRVYSNSFVREWDGRDEEIASRRDELRERTEAAFQKDPEVAAVYMGAGAGSVTSVRPAAEVVRELSDDAERILRERAGEALG